MVRRTVPESLESILIRKPNIIPVELNPQDSFPAKATLGTNLQPTLGLLMGYFGEATKLVGVSQFNEIRVAQGGSGLNSAVIDSGSQPASYSSSDEISNSSGFLRFDVLVQTQTADIQVQLLDGSTLADWILPAGRYSFDFECIRVRIKYNSASGGTYQLIGFRHDPAIRL